MKPAFWFIVLLVASSGFSAYIGNEWGRKIGKRKLSIFKLRPKHTSTFLTILLSMSISLSGLGAGLLLMPQFRQALLNERPEDSLEAYQMSLAQSQETIRRLNQRQAAASSAQPSESELPVESAATQGEHQRPESANAEDTEPLNRSAGSALAHIASPPRQDRTATRRADRMRPHAVRASAPGDVTPLAPVSDSSNSSENGSLSPDASLLEQTAVTQARIAGSENASTKTPRDTPAVRRTERAQRPPTDSSLRLAHVASASSASPRTQDSASQQKISREPQTVRYSEKPIFALKVLGNLQGPTRNQVIDGVLEMTRQYAHLGPTASGGPAIHIQAQNLAQVQSQLTQSGQLEIAVHIGESAEQQTPLPIKLSVQPSASQSRYDPHDALESERLGPTTQSRLQADLRTALLDLRRQRAPQQAADSTVSQQPVRSAALPFDVVNLRQEGLTLTGQLILRSQANTALP